MSSYFSNETTENYEQKWFCQLLIDMSMDKETLAMLHSELQDFHKSVMEDEVLRDRLELSIATFGNDFQIIQKPALMENITMPELDSYNTDVLVNAVNAAVERIGARKRWYKETGQQFYRPLLVLLTKELKEDLYHEAFAHIRKDVSEKKYELLNVGISTSTGVSIRPIEIGINYSNIKGSLAQMIFFNRSYIMWGDYLCEAPLIEDGGLTGMVSMII